MDIILTEFGQVRESGKVTALLNEDYTVYEVFRVMNGVPLFLDEHFDRLLKSVQIQKIETPLTYNEFFQMVLELIGISGKSEGNIRFVILAKEKKPSWYFAFIPAVYPDAYDVCKGVDTELFEAERVNPNAKVLQKYVRFTANRLIEEHQVYEVLLVDNEGFISEGSRSNVFFVKGDVFFTAPESRVLVGITRQKVFVCLNELGFQIIERAVHQSEMKSFDAAFLTGTSPKVLPVKSIGELSFSTVHHGVRALMRKYDEMIAKYIENQKKNR